ncbi:FkbM family methyltransferase [Balneatrix alpica]|uniref:FkbM family methyltransferase n=1 Tax=Balneatrix alpica TaxID=75684 RepID=A0ABV5ZEB6_9GAMM|nr:FkbM family methyltransferase [Balneatrix alpica]
MRNIQLEKSAQLLTLPDLQLKDYDHIYIYGAGEIGSYIKQLITADGQGDKFRGFIETSPSPRSESISLAHLLTKIQSNTAVIIASSYQSEILEEIFKTNATPSFEIWLGNHLFQDAHYVVDQEVKNFILNLCQKSGKIINCAIDIGANVGKFSTLLALFSKEVHLFEPDPDNFAILKARFCEKSKIILNQVGMSDKAGELTLYKDLFTKEATSTTFDVSVSESWSTESFVTHTIPVTSLDEYCQQHKIEPNFIKIDAEGFDLKILKGGLKTIKRHQPIIVFENTPCHIHEYIQVLDELQRIYTLIKLSTQREIKDWSSLQVHPEQENSSYNYALVPKH